MSIGQYLIVKLLKCLRIQNTIFVLNLAIVFIATKKPPTLFETKVRVQAVNEL
jgi:hypothetical protein